MRFGVAAAVLWLSVPAAAQHGSGTEVNPYTTAEHRQAGAKYFRAQCAGCHGPGGAGTGAAPSLVSGTFAHGGSDADLYRTISKGIPGTTMPALAMGNMETWELVTHLRSLNISQAARGTGDAQNGAALFRSHCAGCHTAGGAGGFIGPDLSGVARRRSYAQLSESIHDPDAEVASPYWSVAITTKGGRTLKGTRLNEDTFSLQVRDSQGHLLSLRKEDLKEVSLVRKSPMPSFAGRLSDAQIDDLIAWLTSLGGNQ